MSGFIDWFLKPFKEEITKIEEEEENKIIVPEPVIYRPKSFKEYIGQERSKKILSRYIEAVLKRDIVFPHTLIYGHAGYGKTTLARIIAKTLGVDIIEMITSDVTGISRIIEEIQSHYEVIIFLDELQSIGRDTAEKMYTMMEDGIYGSQDLMPFTLMGATTELGEILKNRRPFYDRFKIIIELENYKKNELIQIAEQYKEHTFPEDEISQALYKIMAENCRGTPRFLLRLLDATVYFNGEIYEVLDSFGIIKDGYTYKDLKVLKYISGARTVGLQGIASYLDTSTENYLFQIEPYLLQNGLITRTMRGRKITNEGLKMIEELEKLKNEV